MAHVKTHVVARRSARGGRSAAEHLVAALRCLYRQAEDDGLITEADNPARKVAKPRRLPSARRAEPDTRLAEINQVAATTGNDPELDTILLREKGETVRWQPISPRPDGPPPGACQRAARPAGGQSRWRPAIALSLRVLFPFGPRQNYTSCEFARTLKIHNLRQSVGRTGICYDNAMAESFFAALKNECV